MTEAHIQSLLKDHERRLRRYFEEIKNGPQTFDAVERAYERNFQDGGIDVVDKGMKLLSADKKKLSHLRNAT